MHDSSLRSVVVIMPNECPGSEIDASFQNIKSLNERSALSTNARETSNAFIELSRKYTLFENIMRSQA